MGDHRKRLTAPDAWNIPKKNFKYVPKTSPGPHTGHAMPIAIWLRDHMGFARDMKEVRAILNRKEIILNGRFCRDPNIGIGTFDVISIPRIGKHYTILPDERGKFVAREIPAERAEMRLCKVRNKTIVKGGRTQVNLLFGANILAGAEIRSNDSVVITLGSPLDPSKKRFQLVDRYPFEVGGYAMIIGGRHSGRIGRIISIEKNPGNIPNRVVLEDTRTNERFDTIERYIFMVGRTPEEAARWGFEG